ncbi:MAG TPA: signal peptidase I [Candidatus Limnocylindrales bacterium]|nr:signal peptidase I [Candidatus Limnocylindrales bacterium]
MKTILGNLLTTIAFTVLLVLCLAFVGIRVSGFSTYIVTGGSMEPGIAKGSLVVVQPVDASAVRVGDVITFQQYDQTTTHRVTAITSDTRGLVFKTKGDANQVADPEEKIFAAKVGMVKVAVPLAGYLTSSVQSYWRLVLTLLAAITFFTCAGALILRKEKSPAAMRKPVTSGKRVLVPATMQLDPDEAWQLHLAWLRTHRRQGMALAR